FMDAGGRPATWANLARWSAAALDAAQWTDVADMNDAFRRAHYTRRVAVMNLKKQPGGAICYPPAVWDAARRDAGFLVQQVGFYRPHLTVAAGTFDVLQQIFDIPRHLVERVHHADGEFDSYAKHNSLGVLLSFWHPAARHTHRVMFEYFDRAIRALR